MCGGGRMGMHGDRVGAKEAKIVSWFSRNKGILCHLKASVYILGPSTPNQCHLYH